MTTTTAKVEANRLNAKKSTGPRTIEGKNRSRYNALKHGMSARTPVLPGEDPVEFQERLAGFLHDLRPQNTIERFLVERAALVTWQLERANAPKPHGCHSESRPATPRRRSTTRMKPSTWENACFGTPADRCPFTPTTNTNPAVRAFPGREFATIPMTHPGCSVACKPPRGLPMAARSLGRSWCHPRPAAGLAGTDRFKVIRLLGKQPLAALDDPELASILLACHLLDPNAGEPFSEVWQELTPAEATFCKDRLEGRNIDRLRPADQVAARRVLLEILERESARIEARAQELADESESKAQLALDLLAFDFSPEGERQRRYQATCTRFVTRVIDSFSKAHRGKDGADRVDSRPWSARTGLPLWHEPPSPLIDPFDPIDPFSPIHGNGAMLPQDTAVASRRTNTCLPMNRIFKTKPPPRASPHREHSPKPLTRRLHKSKPQYAMSRAINRRTPPSASLITNPRSRPRSGEFFKTKPRPRSSQVLAVKTLRSGTPRRGPRKPQGPRGGERRPIESCPN